MFNQYKFILKTNLPKSFEIFFWLTKFFLLTLLKSIQIQVILQKKLCGLNLFYLNQYKFTFKTNLPTHLKFFLMDLFFHNTLSQQFTFKTFSDELNFLYTYNLKLLFCSTESWSLNTKLNCLEILTGCNDG